MLSYVLTAGSGWLGAVAMGFGGLLPYLLRRTVLSRTSGLDLVSSRPYLGRMWPHYWVGYAVAGLSTVHAMLSMSGKQLMQNPAGLWMATVALAFLWLQVWCGLLLRRPLSPSIRINLRRLHFWSMFVMITLIALHIRINQ